MSPRNVTAVVFGVLGLYFVFRTGLTAMYTVHLVWEDVLGRQFLLSESWHIAARAGASVLPFFCSLAVLANRWTLASLLTGPGDEESTTLSLQSLKCAGFVSIGLYLVLDALTGICSTLSSDYARSVPMAWKDPAAQSIRAVVGLVLVFLGPLLARPIGLVAGSE